MEIKDISEQLGSIQAEVKSTSDTVKAEVKAAGEATVETKAALATVESTMAKLDEKLIQVEKEQKRQLTVNAKAEVKTLGGEFIASDEFKGFMAAGGRGNSPSVEIKDITGSAASAGALIPEYRDQTVYMNPNRAIRIRDLVNTMPAMGDAVVVTRELLFTNSAAPQAGQLVDKAKSDLTYENVTYTVETMAHYVIESRQVLSDAPRLQALVNARLPYGLDLLSDEQLLNGDGTGNNLLGLLVDPAIPTVGFTGGATALNHIRSAITTCQTNEYYNVNGIVLNPQDWETIETATGTDEHYLMFSTPQAGSAQQLWGMPVIVTNAMPVGEFLLGDWSQGANLYQREGVTVRTSESHADMFIKNGVAVLAEERYAFGIPLPLAFCKGALTAS